MVNRLEAEFDVYAGREQIGGACAIWLREHTHLLTAFHISHDKKHDPRAIILRSRHGNITLRNISFRKVPSSDDLSLSEQINLTDALPVASMFVEDDQYTMLSAAMSISPEHTSTIRSSTSVPISMRKAPKHIHLSSTAQQIDFGFSGKPILNQQGEVTAVIIGRLGLREDTHQGSAETLRQRIFQ